MCFFVIFFNIYKIEIGIKYKLEFYIRIEKGLYKINFLLIDLFLFLIFKFFYYKNIL